MPQISVVVPVYKVEKYLLRCVNSILAQSFAEFDLILVDDGSPDQCPELCDSLQEKDHRIHVIHQENGGLSAARNTGIEWALKQSESQWITFIDSDDWVHPQYLEAFISAVTKSDLDVCMCQFHITSEYSNRFDPITEADFAVHKTETAFLMEELDPNSACGRLFRKELFTDIRFPVGKLHEDRYTTYKLLFQFPNVGVIQKPMYFYYVNSEGIVHSEWSLRKLDDLEATEQQMAYFKEKQMKDMYVYTVKDYIHLLVHSLRNMKGRSEYRAQERRTRAKLRETLKQERQTLDLSFKKDFNTYKYAYPFAAKVYRRIWKR